MKIYYCIILALLGACNSPENNNGDKKNLQEKQDEKNEKSAYEDECISLVDTLPEILTLRNQIETTTRNHNRLTIWVAADPAETKIKYYWVKAGEDNGDNILTHYNFYVDPKKKEILFYDVIKDTLISLKDWRK